MNLDTFLREQGIPEERISELAKHRLGDVLNDDGSSEPAFKLPDGHFYRAKAGYAALFPIPTLTEYLEARSKPPEALPVSAPPETPDHLLSTQDYVLRREARKREAGPSMDAIISDSDPEPTDA